jgi:hypothetical protein
MNKFLCLDCGVNTSQIGEYYYINLDTWLSVVHSKEGMLCIGCLEIRLGRRLNSSDFTKCFINDPKKNTRMSVRLLERINDDKTTSNRSKNH